MDSGADTLASVSSSWLLHVVTNFSAYDLAVWDKIAKEFDSGNVLITMGTGSMTPLEEKE